MRHINDKQSVQFKSKESMQEYVYEMYEMINDGRDKSF